MAQVLLFHHAQGMTSGILSFADELRAAGHVVHTPDLYEGKTFTNLSDGVGYAKQVGFDTIIDRGRAAAADLPGEIVYAGFSLGVMPAQMLAQTRRGAKGALLFSACFPTSEFRHSLAGGRTRTGPHDGRGRVGTGTRPRRRPPTRRDGRQRRVVSLPRRSPPL